MPDYNANIKVNADTRQAESQLKRLQTSLDKLSDISAKVNLQSAQQQFNKLGTTLRGVGERGALGAITLGVGKAAASIGSLGAKFGILGAAAASAGATINGALGGVPGVITDILAQVGNIPNAFGLAAVAAMAFAPQILKASSATVGLGAAIDKAVGKQTTEKIAGVVNNIGRLNVELKATKATFESLVSGSTLNQLNNQLKDAVKESGAFHSSTEDAVTAAQQLVTVQKEQRREQKAITDLIRQAQGLQPQDVRDTEVARRVALLKSREVQQKKDLQLQNQINAELAEYERLAAEVANQTKQWANNLDRIARSSKAGVLGSQSQLQARLQEFRENRRSADIARERSAELAARERQLAGGQYSLGQVPARGELFPGGRTETAAQQYRDMLNMQAFAQQALEKTGKSRLQTEAAIFRTTKQISSVQAEQNKLDERSVQLIREKNALLLEEYKLQQRKPIAAMTPQERTAAGVLDPASLRADRMRRIEQANAMGRVSARDRAQQRRQMTENVIIGGAFPMLFGGGPGAVLGGAAGGLIPGNPMLSVATSAIGAAIDQFVTKVAELGIALNNVGNTFETLKEKSLISNREREKELQLLQDAGFAATANAVAQQELYKTIGVSGVESLRELGSETDRLNRTWAELSVQLQAVVAGPLADLAAKLNEFFKPIAQAGRAEALRGDLSPADKARFDQELNRLAAKGTYRPTGQMNRPQLEALATFKPEQLQATLDKFGKLRVNAEVKFDPAQVREQTINILQKQLEVLDITKKFSEAGEKQREIDRQRYEIIENYEDSIATIRRRIEDEISSKRLSVIQKENELLDVQARIRQEGLSLANMQAQATAGEGLPAGARDIARQAAEAAGTFVEQELALAEQAAKLKRDAAFDALRTDLEAAKFQADTAREVNKLNIDTAKKVAALNDNIRKQNAQQDGRRFEIERQLALLRLDAIKAEYELLKKYSIQVRDLQMLTIVGEALLDLKGARETVSRAQPPTAVRQAAGPAMQGVSFAGLDAINEQLKLTQERINAAQLALNDLLVLKNEQDFIAKMQRIAGSIDAPIETLNEELATNEKTRTRYAELIRQGVRGAVAERLIEVEQLKEAAVLQYDAVIAELEKKLAIEGTNEALEDQIKKYKERRDAIEGRAATATAGIQKEESPAERLKGAITKAREELTDLTDPINQVVAGAQAIGDAFSQAFKGLVSGAMTGQQALAAFFKGVGDHFLDMASKMIAKLIEIYILETVLGFITGGISGAAGNTDPGGKAIASGSSIHTAAKGAYWPGGFQAFADGGMVTKPTMGLIGEGGEPEYVIPASKMRGAMARYAAGARGSAVIPGNGTSGGGGAVGSGSGAIDVRYTVERINSVDYVTADQFQKGMAQAARQGAEQGERRALGRLRNSPTTRNRVGV